MIDSHPASASTGVAERARPADGDIVVQEQRRGQLLVYLLRARPGPYQIMVPSRDTALAQTKLIANRLRVRAWLTTDGQAHVPLEEVFDS